MDREKQTGAVPQGGAAGEEGHEHGGWLQHLGPEWVEIEPGIFQPPEKPSPPPGELQSLDDALRERAGEHEPEKHADEQPAQRSWWRSG